MPFCFDDDDEEVRRLEQSLREANERAQTYYAEANRVRKLVEEVDAQRILVLRELRKSEEQVKQLKKLLGKKYLQEKKNANA